MSIKKISKEQPDNFEFNSENLSNAKKAIIEKANIYPGIAKAKIKAQLKKLLKGNS